MGETLHILGRQARFVPHFQDERRNEGDQVGVAAPLAKAVQGTLHLPCAGTHRRQTVGDRVAGIVVAMDAKMLTGDMLGHRPDDSFDVVGKRAAVGIAQHDPSRAGLMRRLEATQGVLGVVLVAIEEVLGVEQHFRHLVLGQLDAVRDHPQVFFEIDVERGAHLEIPGLADQTRGIGAGCQNGRQTGIVVGAPSRPACHTERGETRVLQSGRRRKTRCRSDWRRANRLRRSQCPTHPMPRRSPPCRRD